VYLITSSPLVLARETLEENNRALESERKLNVELLYSMFPADVAKTLLTGNNIIAKELKDITMLFSDIVGFTSICSRCSAMEVISLLGDLYVEFDRKCGIFDVYKVETIGDAYCVAGGLHSKSQTHAQQVAWMALFMLKQASRVSAPDGAAVKMRIGLHTGSVVSGVLGTRKQRYCLFGNNVTLANKFESCSEPGRIYISPTCYSFLSKTAGFKFTSRPREALPNGFPENIPGVGYFLDSYSPVDLEKKINLQQDDDETKI